MQTLKLLEIYLVISSQLIAGGLTVPGKLSITGQLKVGSWTLIDRNGYLQFIKDGGRYFDC
jgi:hypothetical protein